jgi:hypothetical protein
MKHIALYADFKGIALGLFTRNKHDKRVQLNKYKLVNPVSLVDVKEVIEVWKDENEIDTIITNDEFFKEELDDTTLIEQASFNRDIMKFLTNINDKHLVFKSDIDKEIKKELEIFEENTSVVNHVVYMIILGMKYDGLGYEWMRELVG